MKDILEELYYLYHEDIKIIIDGKTSEILNSAENELCRKLDGDERKLFGEYEKAYSDFNSVTGLESFKQGFKKGVEFERRLCELS